MERKIGVFLNNSDIVMIALLKAIRILCILMIWTLVFINPEEHAKCWKFVQKVTCHPVHPVHTKAIHLSPWIVWSLIYLINTSLCAHDVRSGSELCIRNSHQIWLTFDLPGRFRSKFGKHAWDLICSQMRQIQPKLPVDGVIVLKSKFQMAWIRSLPADFARSKACNWQ